MKKQHHLQVFQVLDNNKKKPLTRNWCYLEPWWAHICTTAGASKNLIQFRCGAEPANTSSDTVVLVSVEFCSFFHRWWNAVTFLSYVEVLHVPLGCNSVAVMTCLSPSLPWPIILSRVKDILLQQPRGDIIIYGRRLYFRIVPKDWIHHIGETFWTKRNEQRCHL